MLFRSQAAGNVNLDVFGFVQLEGSFAIKKADGDVTLAGGEEVAVNRMIIGGTVTSAFAGLNGGSDDALGMELSGVEFGLALMTGKDDPARSWTSLQGSVDSASFVGVDGLTVAVTSLGISINQAGLGTDRVIDYGTDATDLTIATGPSSDLTLTMEGSKGRLLQVAGDFELDVFGFLQVEGSFAIEDRKSTRLNSSHT